jgi:hypothetical protein
MGIRMERFPEHGVTLAVYSGVVCADEAMTHFRSLAPADLVRRINYFDPTVDYRVDVATIPELKGVIEAKLLALDEDERAAAAFVSSSGDCSLLRTFWPNYLAINENFPGARLAFVTLEEAYDWLDLPDDARRAVSEAVQTHAGKP